MLVIIEVLYIKLKFHVHPPTSTCCGSARYAWLWAAPCFDSTAVVEDITWPHVECMDACGRMLGAASIGLWI